MPPPPTLLGARNRFHLIASSIKSRGLALSDESTHNEA